MLKLIKEKNISFYSIFKDLIILSLIAGVCYFGYNWNKLTHAKMVSFERSLNAMGTGISIDNQRKAKIEKANNMILSKNPSLPYEISMNYAEWFVDEADKYPNVDFVLLLSIASKESGFNYKAKSPMGAKGLMQLMPGTAMDMCEYLRMAYTDSVLYDPKSNIRLGAKYVNNMMTLFNNNVTYVISAYNAGEQGARRYKAYKDGITNADGISKENMEYVPSVLNIKKKYEGML